MFYEYKHFELAENVKVSCGRNLNFPSHMHQSFEIMAVLSGKMEVTVDDRQHILNEGEATLIFPNQIHSMESRECNHMVCIFSPELVMAFAGKVSGMVPDNNFFVPDQYLLDGLKQMTDTSSLMEKKGLLYLLCDAFDKKAVYKERNDEDKSLLYKIVVFVEKNYNQDCSLKRLSQETGYSYAYLSRYFKGIVGISYNDYVNKYRINNACYLLINSNCSVLQCALDSGYESLRSFNRNFIDYMSDTPNVYRKRHQTPSISGISQ